MATNEFLPFAADPAANAMLQSDYAAAGFTARVLGFQTGTAVSLQLNKVWRQASLIANMIGNFTVAETGLNMLDDGSPAGLSALQNAFTAAVKQAATGGLSLNYLPLSGGTITGPLGVNAAGWQLQVNAPAGQPAAFWINRPAGQNALMQISSSSVARWNLVLASGEPETGGNAGSNFVINRHADNGTFLDTPFNINRATGRIDLTQSPTVRGGPLPYMPISGGSFTGPLYVPAPGITYGGTEGHWISFGWDGTAIVGHVDGNPTIPGQLATRAYVGQVAGAYLPIAGGTITGNLHVNNSIYAGGGSGFGQGCYFGGLTDFVNFAGGGGRFRCWAGGNWFDSWNGDDGRRFWVTWNMRSMQLDGDANWSVSGTAMVNGARIVSIGNSASVSMWSPPLGFAMGLWLGNDYSLWVGTTDGAGNPASGRNRVGGDGTFTNWDGIRTFSWLQVDGGAQVNGNLISLATILSTQTGGAIRIESAFPCFVSFHTGAGIGGGWRADAYGITQGQADSRGNLNNLSTLRWDGWFFVAGNVGTPSDAAFKSAIRPSRQFDSLTALRGLDSIAFDWASTGNHQPFGLLASALRERLPDVVVEHDGRDYVDQTSLLVHVIRALQQLAQRIGD